MRTERFSLLCFFGLFFLLLMNSCEDKPDVLGIELLPGGDIMTISFDSLGMVYGHTITLDSVVGNFKKLQILGSQVDHYFGFSKAELITQMLPSVSSGTFGTNPVTDSVILFLPIREIKGIGAAPLRVSVYEYTDSISSDSIYYADMDITGKYRDQVLGTGQVSENDSVVKIWITDNDFIDKFLTAQDSVLGYTKYLRELISGLYISCDDALSEGDEGFVVLDWSISDHKLAFYYKNDSIDSLYQDYQLGQYTIGINLFKQDYTEYLIEPYIDNGLMNDSMLFVQSMGGVSPLIHFVGLLDWRDSVPVAIVDAKLIIPVVDTNLTWQGYEFAPPNLKLYRYNGSSLLLNYDDALLTNGSGGGYSSELNSYVFNLKVHIQSIIQGDLDSEELLLSVEQPNQSVSRTVLHGWSQDPERRMKLEITYAKL